MATDVNLKPPISHDPQLAVPEGQLSEHITLESSVIGRCRPDSRALRTGVSASATSAAHPATGLTRPLAMSCALWRKAKDARLPRRRRLPQRRSGRKLQNGSSTRADTRPCQSFCRRGFRNLCRAPFSNVCVQSSSPSSALTQRPRSRTEALINGQRRGVGHETLWRRRRVLTDGIVQTPRAGVHPQSELAGDRQGRGVFPRRAVQRYAARGAHGERPGRSHASGKSATTEFPCRL